MLLYALLGACSVAILLSTYASLRIWVRSAPARLLAECEAAQRSAAIARAEAKDAKDETERLRGAWHTTTQDLEKYLDSIDSRARRLSATRSAEERETRRANQRDEDGADPEAVIAMLRAEHGL